MTTYLEFLARTVVLDTGCRMPISIRWPGRPLRLTWDGYTQVTVDGRRGRSHKIAWEMVNGPVNPALTLDHLCRFRPCCEVTHLEPVPMSVNALRGELPDVARAHMKRVSALRRRCDGCLMESNPAGLAHHQRATGHSGHVNLGTATAPHRRNGGQ